ncbi:iron chelate uptake ABC transporter family permease subunit [Corynebacterium sp. YIM 101645]|uniref:Iron chelate uptake ABC transporter family permease subunit n=1 Tax=Corynebacterium lemuris TaxID=1859292 RepID=A0ABT2FUL9_9CORY|nr:iron chelate uptake ABC transporter family permease subunit [Corynebacterium lemuris]MCS5478928.1 iron chelate uptake ABC transporter family permease subunit [Corynebacterium lemuris]
MSSPPTSVAPAPPPRSRPRPEPNTWVRFLGLAAVIVVAAAGLMVLSLLVGARATDAGEVLAVIPQSLRYAMDPVFAATMPFNDLVILIGGMRVPRTFLALIAGAALGAAGALIQGFTRNPLADPGILGINAGAAAAVAISLALGIVSSPDHFVWPALVGAGAATLVVFLLASAGPIADSPLGYILAGMALSALLMSVVNALMLKDAAILDALRLWATGSVANRDFSVVKAVLPLLILGLILALLLGRTLNLLSLGDEVAAALGINVTISRLVGMSTVAVLGAVAVACAGPVMFIGLAAPHMVRAVTGPDHRAIIPLSIGLGALLALSADILGRLIARPGELPMGIVLALIGVPFFIMLIRRGRLRGAL